MSNTIIKIKNVIFFISQDIVNIVHLFIIYYYFQNYA